MRPEGTKCPHENIIHCPLYIGAHVAYGPSCDDGGLGAGTCAVDRGRHLEAGATRDKGATPKAAAA